MNECCFCENRANIGICSQCQESEHQAFVDLKQQLADAWAEIERKDKLIEQITKLLKAVRSTNHYGVDCLDVNDQNWFDARDAALSAAERIKE